jgi:hypothetical protein
MAEESPERSVIIRHVSRSEVPICPPALQLALCRCSPHGVTEGASHSRRRSIP